MDCNDPGTTSATPRPDRPGQYPVTPQGPVDVPADGNLHDVFLIPAANFGGTRDGKPLVDRFRIEFARLDLTPNQNGSFPLTLTFALQEYRLGADARTGLATATRVFAGASLGESICWGSAVVNGLAVRVQTTQPVTITWAAWIDWAYNAPGPIVFAPAWTVVSNLKTV